MIAKRKGKWIDDLFSTMKALVIFGFASMIIIPILIVVIIVLAVK